MTTALRASVADVLYPQGQPHRLGSRTENPGLELSRYLKQQKGSERVFQAREDLLKRIENAGPPNGYAEAVDRWQTSVQSLPGAIARARFVVEGRLAIGLGTESVLENSMTVNRPWGMPMIPGSALKGLASHYLVEAVANGDPDLLPATLPPGASPGARLPLNSHGILFGTTDSAGYVVWHDAWYVPIKSQPSKPFRRDIVTNHHPSYYRNRGKADARPPWDFDDPIPNQFITVTGPFLVAIQAPDAEWADFALDLLAKALEHYGVGAKTSAGYGRMKLSTPFDTITNASAEDATSDFIAELEATPSDRLSAAANPWYVRWKEEFGQSPEIARLIVEQLRRHPKTFERVIGKAYGKDLLAAAGGDDGENA